MAAAIGPSRIWYRCEAVQQTQVILGLDGPDNGELAQASGDGRGRHGLPLW